MLFRLIVEVASVRRAATAGSGLTGIEATYRAMTGAMADPGGEFHRLDIEFHRGIAELSHNPELTDAVARVHQRIQAARVRAAVVARTKRAHRQHAQILTALRHGDADAAEAAMTEHIESAKDHVLAFMADEHTD